MDKEPKKTTPSKVKVAKPAKVESVVNLPAKITRKAVVASKVKVVKSETKAKPFTKVAKKLPVKKVSNKTTKNPDDVKLVPGTISLRLAEKRKLYERVYHDYVPKVMRPVAITGGYAYITIGIFLALLMANPALSNIVSQTASVLCFSGACAVATSSDAVRDEMRAAEFMPLAEVVPNVDTNLQLVLNVEDSVRVLILPISSGDSMIITGVTESATNIVNFLLPTATLSNGEYLLQAETFDADTKQVKVKVLGPKFTVQNLVLEELPTEPTAIVEVDDEDTTQDDVNVEGEVLGVATSTSLETEDDLIIESEESVEIEEAEAENIIIDVQESKSFTLTVLPGTTSNQSVFKLTPTYVFNKVELALKHQGGSETFFLGAATKSADVWFYWFDGYNIPAGDYNLIVTGYDNDQTSEEATFLYSNVIKTSATPQSIRTEIEERVGGIIESNIELDPKELIDIKESYATFYTTDSENYDEDFLVDYLPKLDTLFTNYAGALAGKNEAIIILADEQIEMYLDKIIVEESENDSNFGQTLYVWLLAVKDFIKTNEEQLVKYSAGDSAFDTDLDGFTDYDEVVIFDTDPKLADTDYDGILDSIEIIKGYSALEAKLEAVPRSANKAVSGVINGERLAITSIDPFYLYSDESTGPKILTSVSGQGIANSFARLYIGDTGPSVMVKVGPDGTFTQTIDRDFARVEGEIILAVTDNTGKIVMRGQPLKLEKIVTSKELFNPKAIDAAVIKSVEEFKTINMIGAIGVVSFGLILLLLGKALIPRREPISLEIA